MSTGAPRHHPLDGSRLPGQHQNSGWPSFNRAQGPVKGPPWLVSPPASIASCNLRCSLGGRPCRCKREDGGLAGSRRRRVGGNNTSTRPGRQGHSRNPGAGLPRGHGDPTSRGHHPSTNPPQSSNRARDTFTREDRLGQGGLGAPECQGAAVVSNSV